MRGVFLIAFAWTATARAEGVLVIATSTTVDDLRTGALAAGFARRGSESFVALDMIKPPPETELELVRARRFLDNARRHRRNHSFEAARDAGDVAIQILERCSYEPGHLSLLVETLAERGAVAIALGDSAKAETVFLEAISLDPSVELDDELFDEDTRRLFGEVHRASRQLRYGSIRIEVSGMTGASITIDFSSPKDPPYEAKLSDGRHFVSVSAPGRHEVVSFVPVRAGRQTDLFIRPPLAGDPEARREAIARFRPSDAGSIAALSSAAGLRFVAIVDLGKTNLSIGIYDGNTGAPIEGASAVLSANPAPEEIDAAVDVMIARTRVFDPAIESSSSDSPWYLSWWAISILGVAIAGAATATAIVLATGGETEYRFER